VTGEGLAQRLLDERRDGAVVGGGGRLDLAIEVVGQEQRGAPVETGGVLTARWGDALRRPG
jgi:hypothetical protein